VKIIIVRIHFFKMYLRILTLFKMQQLDLYSKTNNLSCYITKKYYDSVNCFIFSLHKAPTIHVQTIYNSFRQMTTKN